MGNGHIMDEDEEDYVEDLVLPEREDYPDCDTPLVREDSFMRGDDDKRYIDVPPLRSPSKFGNGNYNPETPRDVYLFLALFFLFLFLYEFMRRSRVYAEMRLKGYNEMFKADKKKDTAQKMRDIKRGKNKWLEKYRK